MIIMAMLQEIEEENSKENSKVLKRSETNQTVDTEVADEPERSLRSLDSTDSVATANGEEATEITTVTEFVSVAASVYSARKKTKARITLRIRKKQAKATIRYVTTGWLGKTLEDEPTPLPPPVEDEEGEEKPEPLPTPPKKLCITDAELREKLQRAGFGMSDAQLQAVMPKWKETKVIRQVADEEEAAGWLADLADVENERIRALALESGEIKPDLDENGNPIREKTVKRRMLGVAPAEAGEYDAEDIFTPLMKALAEMNKGRALMPGAAKFQPKPNPYAAFSVRADDLVKQVCTAPEKLFDSLRMALDQSVVSPEKGAIREAALILLGTVCLPESPNGDNTEWKVVQPLLFPYALSLLLPALRCLAPGKNVSLKNRVEAAAQNAVEAILAGVERQPLAVGQCVQTLMAAMDHTEKWQTVQAACNAIERMSERHPRPMARWLAELVPKVAEWLADTKPEVRESAIKAMDRVANDAMDNDDVRPLLPALLSSMTNPDEVLECIFKLASTTFVQTVTCAPLAMIAPLLVRGLALQARTATKRMSAVIVNNMSKLVEEPCEAVPFLPKLLPLLEAAGTSLADQEARGVCLKAYEQLVNIQTEAETAAKQSGSIMLNSGWASREGVHKVLLEAVGAEQQTAGPGDTSELMLLWPTSEKGKVKKAVARREGHTQKVIAAAQCLELCSWMCCALLDKRSDIGIHTWTRELGPLLLPVLYRQKDVEGGLEESITRVCKKIIACGRDGPEEEEDIDTAEMLCDTKFTLAFGSKILLHNTRLVLRRGMKYGLLGCNDCGKTSLLRAIADEQIEGFPDSSEVSTSFVEADISPDMSEMTCVQYVQADERVKTKGISEADVRESLNNVGFVVKKDGRYAAQDDPVDSLSGGWRMKLALARVMLHNSDVLLMDEPTNHLDVINVQWVLEYLRNLTNVTAVIVSTHKQLLTDVATHVIHIDRLKLNMHKGNLDDFVKVVPSAKSYFDFAATKTKFKFPQPSFIEGIKSKGKALMKMKDVEFTYPGNDSTTLRGITVQVSLASRVACVGRNGAGKSTMVKLLTGELEAGGGDCWQHPGCRCAYVAQHAFHHIENHLEMTANEYIRWRYQYGEDREAVEKKTMVLTDEELADCGKKWEYEIVEQNGAVTISKRSVKRMTGLRRKDKKSGQFEYEVVWLPASIPNTWERSFLLTQHSKGFEKQIKVIDTKEAAKAGMYIRPLTQKNVEEHLEDIGLAAEFGTHNRMSALSGGQKVKVVIAASMWNQPHIVILDEPTNYLDRESLGALAHAIEAFDGGVVIISHNDDFCSKLCRETWVLEMGDLNCKGDAEWMKKAEAAAVEVQELDEMIDGAGNKIKLKTAEKTLDRKERKMLEKELKEMQANGEDTYELEVRLGHFDEVPVVPAAVVPAAVVPAAVVPAAVVPAVVVPAAVVLAAE